jgi:hypothetical protein
MFYGGGVGLTHMFVLTGANDFAFAAGNLQLDTWYIQSYNTFPDTARQPVTSPIVLGLGSNPVGLLIQFRSLDADPKVLYSVGSNSRNPFSIPQTPASYTLPGGGECPRSPRALDITKMTSTCFRGDLVHAPYDLKAQLALLVERGKIEVYDVTAAVALTGDDIRAL